MIFLNQEQFLAGTKHIFKAIFLNPYFPYNNYEEFKHSYNRRYGAQLSLKSPEYLDEVKDTLGNPYPAGWYYQKAAQLNNSVQYEDGLPFNEILKRILQQNENPQVATYIENALNTDFCEETVRFIIRSEVIKYLPKGTEKIDEIYVERIPEVLVAIEEALKQDDNFPLLHTRIGIFKLMLSTTIENDEERKNESDIAMQRFLKGIEYFHGLGLFPPPKEENG